MKPLVEPALELTPDELRRYSRQIILDEIGLEGQLRLKNARVLVIGAGGLGSPVLLYLAGAGVGTLGIVDDDVVEPSNLHRQIIHGSESIGETKTTSAARRARELNPHVGVVEHPVRLGNDNAVALFSEYDLVVDGADNFATRYLVSDAAEIAGVPVVWGSILRFGGQVSVFHAGWGAGAGDGGAGEGARGPTYRDLFPEPPDAGAVPSCAEGGVLGVLPGQIGSMMAAEAIKVITGVGRSLLGRLLVFDALEARWREVEVPIDPSREPVRELVDYEELCGVREGEAEVGIGAPELAELLAARERGEIDFDLVDVREPGEFDIAHIPGSRLVPRGEFVSGVADAAPDRDTILYCKSGGRSADVFRLLRRRGHARARHLEGGILAWIRDVDPELPTY